MDDERHSEIVPQPPELVQFRQEQWLDWYFRKLCRQRLRHHWGHSVPEYKLIIGNHTYHLYEQGEDAFNSSLQVAERGLTFLDDDKLTTGESNGEA